MLSPGGWLVVGVIGQLLFTARFVVQWIVSEKNRDSVVPVAFWWFSLGGGLALLSYATSRRDPVIMIGQVMGLVVYVRNLMLVAKANRRATDRLRHPADPMGPIASRRRPSTGDREILILMRPVQQAKASAECRSGPDSSSGRSQRS